VNSVDPTGLDTYVNCRELGGSGSLGVAAHSAVRVLDPARGIDQTIELIPITVSGRKIKEVYWQGPWDAKLNVFDSDNWRRVKPPCGETSEDFDAAVLMSAFNETLKARGQGYSLGGGNNANRFVYDVIAGAGGRVPLDVIGGFLFGAPGLCGGTGIATGGRCDRGMGPGWGK
jgi:hypothetical protein